jgi:hypothetical protein
MFLGVKCGGCVGLTTLPPSVSPLSRQCGILNISQIYEPPRPGTGVALLLLISVLASISNPKMHLICSSETPGFLETSRRYNPEDIRFKGVIVCANLWCSGSSLKGDGIRTSCVCYVGQRASDEVICTSDFGTRFKVMEGEQPWPVSVYYNLPAIT